MFRDQSGQFSLGWLVGIGASVVIAITGSILGVSNTFSSKVDAVKTETNTQVNALKIEDSNTAQRVSTLEEAIKTLKTDNAEIKSDIKQILKLLK